jgi:hypothetical protein
MPRQARLDALPRFLGVTTSAVTHAACTEPIPGAAEFVQVVSEPTPPARLSRQRKWDRLRLGDGARCRSEAVRFNEMGTDSTTIGMDNEAKRTNQFCGAREERPGDRRELLAVGGAVRRCGVDVGFPIGPLSQNVLQRSAASIPPLASHPTQKPTRTSTRSSARVAGSYVVAPADIRLPREARATQVLGGRASVRIPAKAANWRLGGASAVMCVLLPVEQARQGGLVTRHSVF